MVRASCLLGCCLFAAILLMVPTNAFPSASNYYRDETQYEPEEIMDMLNQLNHLLQLERKLETNPFRLRTPNPTYKEDITSDKRNLDLGLNRGYSGAIQAKHLLGLAAAKYIGGPGRRRRDVN